MLVKFVTKSLLVSPSSLTGWEENRAGKEDQASMLGNSWVGREVMARVVFTLSAEVSG